MRKYYLGECTVKKVKWGDVMRKPRSKFTRSVNPVQLIAGSREGGGKGPAVGKRMPGLECGEDELEAETSLLQVL